MDKKRNDVPTLHPWRSRKHKVRVRLYFVEYLKVPYLRNLLQAYDCGFLVAVDWVFQPMLDAFYRYK